MIPTGRRRHLLGEAATWLLAFVVAGVAFFAWRHFSFDAGELPLQTIADIELPGDTSRFDYASLDRRNGWLFLAHLGAGSVLKFDTQTRRITGTAAGAPSVRGVLVVPELRRVYASAQATHEVVVIDEDSMAIVARIADCGDVDGLAYDPLSRHVFVSDETGRRETVIDTGRNAVVARIDLGGEAGNSVYDSGSGHIFVAVQTRNDLAEIDPGTNLIVKRWPTNKLCLRAHSLVIDGHAHRAFVGCQLSAILVDLDLSNGGAFGRHDVGVLPDVLALDEDGHHVYVASESGIVSMFRYAYDGSRQLGQGLVAGGAHVVIADPRTHLVYLPLQNVGGKPVLRIMQPLVE